MTNSLPLSLRKRTWTLLEPAQKDDYSSKVVDIFLVTLIFLNIIMVTLETVDELFSNYHNFFRVFEYLSVLIFLLEYLARLWSCVENESSKGTNLKTRLKYFISFPALIDLIAILPSILVMFFPTVDLRFIRALRIFRLLKFTRYSNSINSLLSI